MKKALLLTTASLLLSTASAAQLGKSVERPGDGRLVCGLGKEFHTGRRKALMEAIGEELIVLRGLPDAHENRRFSQDKTFWYLTGVETPNAEVLLDGLTGEAVLFLPERTPQLLASEGWEGEKWDASDEWVGELTGFDEILPKSAFLDTIEERLDGRERLGVSLHPLIPLGGSYDTAGRVDQLQLEDPLDGRPTRNRAFADVLEATFDVETFDVAPAINELRRVKTPEEVAALKRAARAGAIAMAEAIRSTRVGIGEWDLDALMRMVQIREGAVGSAYSAIVGAGKHGCVLHYLENGSVIRDGELVLIDFGAEVDHYTTDITRTWPASGTFGPRQREMYEAVLAAQKAGIAAAKPGATMRDVDAACRAVLRERGFGDYIKHFSCHYIGMAVHDPGNGVAPAVPGTAFTIEPGLYDDEAGIGIRIEDVVVITEDGCEVISDLVPKEVDEVEALVAETGVLDVLDGKAE